MRLSFLSTIQPTAHTPLWLGAFMLAAVALITAAGCSGSDSPTGTGTGTGGGPLNGGSGTATLKIVMQIEGGDIGGGAFDTDFLATVTDTVDSLVSGATVTVTGPFGSISLVEDALNPGSYSATRAGYTSGTYVANVVRGLDNVTNVRVVAPTPHTITSPRPQDLVATNQPIDVRWTRIELAEESRVETRDYVGLWVTGDTGALTIPAIGNPPRADQRVRVKRVNRQDANGGLPGSAVSASIRLTVEPVISQ